MNKIKMIFAFLLGIGSVALYFNVQDKIKAYTNEDGDEMMKENLINMPSELGDKIYLKFANGEKLFLPNPEKVEESSGIKSNVWVKTSIGLYNAASTCLIDADVSGNFSSEQNGKSHVSRIVISDFSSEESRIECSKVAMEQVLPLILKGAFSGIIKNKIYEEGTIFKTFNKVDIIDASKKNLPLVFDGGFTMETLNVGVLLTPNRFEVYITDCANIKCGE